VILNINQPIISAATHAQLARGLKRQIGGDREFPARTTP
jgi:hypothetical protein